MCDHCGKAYCYAFGKFQHVFQELIRVRVLVRILRFHFSSIEVRDMTVSLCCHCFGLIDSLNANFVAKYIGFAS